MKRWDARTVTDRIESAVGRDLQFIRVNGTLVGGLVGVIIHPGRQPVTPAPEPAIVTERLEVRRPCFEDMEAMFAIIGEPETGRHLGSNLDFPDHVLRFFRNAGSWQLCGYGAFMVRLRGEPGVLGELGDLL